MVKYLNKCCTYLCHWDDISRNNWYVEDGLHSHRNFLLQSRKSGTILSLSCLFSGADINPNSNRSLRTLVATDRPYHAEITQPYTGCSTPLTQSEYYNHRRGSSCEFCPARSGYTPSQLNPRYPTPRCSPNNRHSGPDFHAMSHSQTSRVPLQKITVPSLKFTLPVLSITYSLSSLLLYNTSNHPYLDFPLLTIGSFSLLPVTTD